MCYGVYIIKKQKEYGKSVNLPKVGCPHKMRDREELEQSESTKTPVITLKEVHTSAGEVESIHQLLHEFFTSLSFTGEGQNSD